MAARADRQSAMAHTRVAQFNAGALIWYLVEPVYSCDMATRVGAVVGDGAKYVCNTHHIAQQRRCVYYGFGVDREVIFEEALIKLLPACEFHAFDPTPSVVAGSMPAHLRSLGIAFHPWGIAAQDGNIQLEGRNVVAYSFEHIRELLNHSNTVIDIFKIDVEGSEWQSLPVILANCDAQRPAFHQMQVEMHGPKPATLLAFDDRLTACGYRVFSKDANHWCPDCMEYGYVHQNFILCQ